MYKSVAVALLAGLLAVPAAVLASNNAGKAAADSRDAGRKSSADPAQPKDQRPGSDLESCKRDADGMKGPERSRFMTECLKQRK
jgi:hypothetical protein